MNINILLLSIISIINFIKQKNIMILRQLKLGILFKDIRLGLLSDIKIMPPKSTHFVHHGFCVVIGSNVKLGSNVKIYHNTTIGESHPIGEEGYEINNNVVIKDNVIIYTGATIIGNVTIGENSIVAAHALVTKNVPPHSLAKGVPAKCQKLGA